MRARCRTMTANTAGMMLINTAVRNVLTDSKAWLVCVSHMIRAVIPIPRNAPAVSPARCKPNARPACFESVLAATTTSWGGTDTLTGSIRKSNAQHPTPRIGEIQKGLGNCRKTIAQYSQPFTITQSIRQPSRVDLQQAGSRFCNPINQADDRGTHTQNIRQE